MLVVNGFTPLLNYESLPMRTLTILCTFLLAIAASAAEHTTAVYKTVGDRELQMLIVQPDGHAANSRAPAIVYFHGGGWERGSPETGLVYGEALAEHGIVTLAVEYRRTDSVTLDETIKDAAAAIRWTRERGRTIGVDPGKIMAFGHSAGGHLAASTATLRSFDEEDDYTRASPRPNAIAMMAPYPATMETAADYLPAGADISDYAPRQNIDRRLPPVLIIQGDADTLVEPAVSEAYHDALLAAGVESTLFIAPGVDHYFREEDDKTIVSDRLQKFASDLGWLD
jgi:acetyl esterase/lipase